MTRLCRVTDLPQFPWTFPGLALKVQCPWSLANREGRHLRAMISLALSSTLLIIAANSSRALAECQTLLYALHINHFV